MNALLQAELDRRKARGETPSTLTHVKQVLAELGYRLDRSGDCHGMSRYMTGEDAGCSYPCTTTYIVEADTGVGFAHYKDARRDENFRKLQALRFSGELFAVVRGRILEI